MSSVSPIFAHHYDTYLSRLGELDFGRLAPVVGADLIWRESRPGLRLSLFGRPYTVFPSGITGPEGKTAGYDTCILLSRYLLMARDRKIPGKTHAPQWTGFRDLKESGPLLVYFRDNVEGTIARQLAGNLDHALEKLQGLHPVSPELDLQYDLAVQTSCLPRMPVLLLFNDREEDFPPKASVLFDQDVETWLDAECIAMAGFKLASVVKTIFS